MRSLRVSIALATLIGVVRLTEGFAAPLTPRGGFNSAVGRSSLPSAPAAAVPSAASARSLAVRQAVETKGGGGDESTLGVSTFNLVKSIVGAGVLALPAGVAAFGSTSAALLPASLLIAGMGSLAGYCFIIIGRLCEATGTSTYRDMVAACSGKKAGNALGVASMCKTLVACLMYSIIIGDMTHALSHTLLPAGTLSSMGAMAGRVPLLWAMTACVITPLCLLRSFAALKVTSLLGILGTCYTACMMVIRKLDGSYAVGGKYHAQIAKELQPAFGVGGNPVGIFVLLSMLSTAFVAHYNAPKFYSELKDKSVKKFTTLTGLSFGIAAAIFGTIMVAGFTTFGASAQGLVLNNYASADKLSTIARVATLLTIIFGYPFTFVPARDSLIELTGWKASQKDKDVLSLGMLAILTSVACVLRNLGLVASLSGALLGSLVIYIFPASAFVAGVQSGAVVNKDGSLNTEVNVNKGITATGYMLAVIGVTVTFVKTFAPHMLK